jgi:hypothetical protein
VAGRRSANPAELERLRRRFEALVYGASDMQSAAQTAEYLNDVFPPHRDLLVRRTIEAGLVVVYSRPFLDSRGRSRLSPSSELDERLRAVHNDMLERRRRDYAHTDETAYRMVIQLEEPDWMERLVMKGPEAFAETWRDPTPYKLEDLRALAVLNRESFGTEIERLRERLRIELDAG